MNRPEFERQIATLRERILELPADQREALETMVSETITRNEQIHRASLQGYRAAERLELAFERLGEGCRRLIGLAGEARRSVQHTHTLGRTGPGLN